LGIVGFRRSAMHALKYRNDEAYIPRAAVVRPVEDAGVWDAEATGDSPAHVLQRHLAERLGGVAATLDNPDKYDVRLRLAVIVVSCGLSWAAIAAALIAAF
jgi:hypothetical protein